MMALSLLPLFEWIESTPVGQGIRQSASLIALVEAVHLVGMTLLLGTLLMVDLSLMGLGIGRAPASRIARELRGWTLAGLAIMLASGPLMLSSEAVRCYHSPPFWIKMALLAVAVTFHFTFHNKVVAQDPPAQRLSAVWTACVSLGLWTSIALAGKAIAIFQPN